MPTKNRSIGFGRALSRAMGREEIRLTVEDRGSGESLLMCPRRREVFQEVALRPCLHVRHVARTLGISPQSASWHLRRLAEDGYVSSTPWRGRSAHCPDRFVLQRDVPLVAALRRDLSAASYEAIRRSPGIRQVDLVAATGTYQQAVLPHLKDLQTMGLILCTRSGKTATHYRTTNLLEDLSEEYSAREEDYAAWTMGVLEADHLLPKVVSRRKGVLRVAVRPGSEEVELRFPLNPVKTLP